MLERAHEPCRTERPAGGDELSRIACFVAAGAVNTALTLALYQLALFAVGHVAAYGLAYAAGIVFAYIAYARQVFDVPLSGGRFAAFALFYAASWGLGAALNAYFIEHLAWHARLAVFVTVAVMLPVNYLGSKYCMQARAADARR